MFGKKDLISDYFQFTPLKRIHFPLLRHWLEQPHVKAWWDKDILWTDELIEEKYGTYVEGYKDVEGIKRPLYATIVLVKETPVGYIQYYNAYDFPEGDRSTLEGLPQSLAAIDFYIGNPDFIGRGLGSLLLKEFLQRYVWQKFEACFVDPDSANSAAIRTYEKAGFKIITTIQEGKITWMLQEKI